MKINKRTSIKSSIESEPSLTRNYEGGIAFKLEDKERLYTRVASCLVGESKFYKDINEEGDIEENQDKKLIEDIKLVAEQDPEFILKLANYTRNTLNLRTISIVMLVEASLIDKCKPFVRKYTPLIVKRADELAESVAYLQRKIGHIGNKRPKGSMPSCLKKGLADTFNYFDEYNLAKYNRKGFVKLKDVLKLVHPIPKDKEQSAIFKRLKEDNLVTPDTWEVVISTKGSTKENWESIIPKMPYMATLRNLRTFLDKEISASVLVDAVTKLGTPEAILKSRQLPFRYFSAYREIEENSSPYTSKVLDILQSALDVSTDNLPKLTGTTFITADNSGSMDSPLSEKSKVSYKDIANIMCALAHRICEFPISSAFAEDFSIINLSHRDGILTNMQKVRKVGDTLGGSTNAFLSIQYLNLKKIKVDRIIIFSDQQCYDTEGYDNSLTEQLRKYKSNVNPNVYLYSVDLSGYGTAQFPSKEPNICLIAGWSERILEFIKLFEEDKKSVIDRINGGIKNEVKESIKTKKKVTRKRKK